MTRAERLLALVRLLRTHRYPVAGQQLAQSLAISLRTLYRDIATLQAQGADIRGAPGLGYVLHPGFALPPLMFTEHELEALMLGMRWVARRADPALSQAAHDVLAKAEAVLPPGGAERLNRTALFAAGAGPSAHPTFDTHVLRDAIRRERKVRLSYRSAGARVSVRVVRPLGIGYFDQADILAAWCESRQDFRHFRLDRIQALTLLDEGFEGQGGWLLRRWRTAGLAAVPK